MSRANTRHLQTEPDARVMVFIDGQNLYKRCKALYGHPLCHPNLLAEHLAGARTQNRVACRFYTGVPSPNEPGEKWKRRNIDRRLAGMRRVGVTVITRPLRYHDASGIQDHLPRPIRGEAPRTAQVAPWRRPQEKGIDLLIGLDVVEFALTDKFDVAIVVSFDRDMHEIPGALRNLRGLIDRPIRIEAAVPVKPGRGRPIILNAFDYTHQITQETFDVIADRTDYTVNSELWTPASPPERLSDI